MRVPPSRLSGDESFLQAFEATLLDLFQNSDDLLGAVSFLHRFYGFTAALAPKSVQFFGAGSHQDSPVDSI